MRGTQGTAGRAATDRAERGSTIVEFVLIFVIFLMLVGVAVQGAFLFNGWLIATNAAREAARAGAPCFGRPSNAQPCDVSGIKAVARQAAVGTDPNSLQITVCYGPDPGTTPVTQILTVRAFYNVPVLAPFVDRMMGSNRIAVSAQSTMRLENQVSYSTTTCS